MTTITLRNSTVVNDASFLNGGHQAVFLPCCEEAILSAADAQAAASSAQTALNNLVSASGANATSATALTIGLGAKSLTIQAGKNFAIGHTLKVASTAAPSNYMIGDVVAYDALTGALDINVTYINGSGTASSWSATIYSNASGGSSGSKNYVFNGDFEFIQSGGFSMPASEAYAGVDGFAVSAVGGSATCLSGRFTIGTLNYYGKLGGGIAACGAVTVTHKIPASKIKRLSTQALTISCYVYQDTGAALNCSVDVFSPTVSDAFGTLTTLATGLGLTSIPSGVRTKLIATLPAGSDFSKGLKIALKTATVSLASGNNCGFGDIKVGLDSNFESNSSDLIDALAQLERSYESGVASGTVTTLGCKRAIVLTGGTVLDGADTVTYQIEKRAAVTPVIYSPNNGASGFVAEYTTGAVFVANRVATVTAASKKGFNVAVTGGTPGNLILFHWVADARL
jgi:hypothetical protein